MKDVNDFEKSQIIMARRVDLRVFQSHMVCGVLMFSCGVYVCLYFEEEKKSPTADKP